MKTRDDKKLDNPVWFSLSETDQSFAVDYGSVKFYHSDYCPFGGFEKGNAIAKSIDEYSEMVDSFFIVGEKPELSNLLKVNKELVCLQMIVYNRIDIAINDPIVKLTDEHIDALYELVNLVQPGYFKKKTALLGNYYGIFKNEELVSVTGERMQMNDFIEVSAVVAHPNHTGKGYAKQLVIHTVNEIFKQNKIPYLHVIEDNKGAIQLYEKLGFSTRRKISFWNITKQI
ncbi:GNAT family N-acetyltransferase [Flavobacterium petrolei]|uniref:GNAT family N-acetyltransferase n=1 Tax=Flavobacterium petrolei TaxID=2259594 RepID=A0A482TV09_9FLAO|nr:MULTISPECIES: GNAT family N-acetyltransferase [Flavobacterium]QIH37562.1 GNAT family N-acetyltransferase [Flavobacterium sp. Sr18]RYJ52094.1 GNAT family N-acetyltransferase [Flavobacterium petrolei]